MSTYPITDTVPVPRKPFRRSPYPFDQLGVGGSFFVPDTTGINLQAGARRFARQSAPDTKFTCRDVTEDGVAGARCWRTA